MATDKATILNGIVQGAAEIMTMKIDETEMIIEQLAEKNVEDIANGESPSSEKIQHRLNTIMTLIQFVEQTLAAVKVMEKNGGCWA